MTSFCPVWHGRSWDKQVFNGKEIISIVLASRFLGFSNFCEGHFWLIIMQVLGPSVKVLKSSEKRMFWDVLKNETGSTKSLCCIRFACLALVLRRGCVINIRYWGVRLKNGLKVCGYNSSSEQAYFVPWVAPLWQHWYDCPVLELDPKQGIFFDITTCDTSKPFILQSFTPTLVAWDMTVRATRNFQAAREITVCNQQTNKYKMIFIAEKCWCSSERRRRRRTNSLPFSFCSAFYLLSKHNNTVLLLGQEPQSFALNMRFFNQGRVLVKVPL